MSCEIILERYKYRSIGKFDTVIFIIALRSPLDRFLTIESEILLITNAFFHLQTSIIFSFPFAVPGVLSLTLVCASCQSIPLPVFHFPA